MSVVAGAAVRVSVVAGATGAAGAAGAAVTGVAVPDATQVNGIAAPALIEIDTDSTQ